MIIKKLLFLLFLAFISVQGYSQVWKNELKKDIVVIQNGKMTATDLTLITVKSNKNSFQIKSYAEALANDFITRDQFVAIFATTTTAITESILAEAGLNDDSYTSKTLNPENLIGNAEIELIFYMGETGIQIVVKSAGNENRLTRTWESLYQ